MNIVITGASRGVGFYTAMRLTEEKQHTVFALSRNEEGLKKLSAEVGSSSLKIVGCDVSNEESVSLTVKEIEKQVDRIDVLINNAGYLIHKPMEKLTMPDWEAVYRVNVFGVFNVTKGLKGLLERGRYSDDKKIKSHVLNISSVGGIQGSMKFGGLSAYSSSKGALITLTECMAEEWKDEGIRANCIALGSVDTEMFREAFPGLRAGAEPMEVGAWIARFSIEGAMFFNGKIIGMSASTP